MTAHQQLHSTTSTHHLLRVTDCTPMLLLAICLVSILWVSGGKGPWVYFPHSFHPEVLFQHPWAPHPLSFCVSIAQLTPRSFSGLPVVTLARTHVFPSGKSEPTLVYCGPAGFIEHSPLLSPQSCNPSAGLGKYYLICMRCDPVKQILGCLWLHHGW